MMNHLAFWFLCMGHACAGNPGTDFHLKLPADTNAITLHEALRFKRINELYYFRDDRLLTDISRFREEQDTSMLFHSLCNYISQFGIGNFQKDTRLIWELGKLSAALGYEDAAVLYKLVVRHHHASVEYSEIRKVQDSLNRLENGRFVSLDKYVKWKEHADKANGTVITHYLPVNLGHKVNSSGPDYAPVYHTPSRSLLFTSQRNHFGLESEKINENLYICTRDSTGNWARARELEEINTIYNEGSGCLSADGKTLYFSRCNSPDSYGNCDLFMSSLKADGTWGAAKNLGAVVNTSGWESHPTLTHSGDTLYFASDRAGGFGQTDIYFTFRDGQGKWVKPQNLGPRVNTKDHDLSPYYHPDHDVLYFSSSGQPNSFGLFDIYKSVKRSGLWGDPENLGPRVNHAGSEMYFTIDPASNLMFFARSSSHQLSKQDLYSFPLPMEAHPESTTTLQGSLTDSLTGEKMDGIASVIDRETGIEVLPRYLGDDGSFAFNLIDKRNYLLVIRGKDFFRLEKELHLDGPTKLEVKSRKISSTITFASINFEFDSASVKDFMHHDLNKIVKFLFDNPDYHLRIEGHTDSEGSHEYNIDLSLRRARNIRDYILSTGINEQRVSFEGFGKERPLIHDASVTGRAINRRVEFHLYDPDAEPAERVSYKSVTSL